MNNTIPKLKQKSLLVFVPSFKKEPQYEKNGMRKSLFRLDISLKSNIIIMLILKSKIPKTQQGISFISLYGILHLERERWGSDLQT